MAVPGGATTSFVYDSEGRVTTITPPLKDSVSYVYAPADTSGSKRAMGNVLQVTQSPRQGSPEAQANQTRVTTIAYEGKSNQVVSYAAPEGTVSISRDPRGNPTSITDTSGVTTATLFSNFGQLLSTDDPRSGYKSYTYETSDPLTAGYLTRVDDLLRNDELFE